MGTAASEQSVMYAAGESQAQAQAKKKAGESVDAKLKAEVTFGFDPSGRFVMKTIKNPTPDMIKPGSTATDIQAAQEAPREDAAAGMALAQQNEDVRSQIDQDKEASAMRLLELRRQKIDRMKNNFNGNWWERRRAAKDMGANFFTSMIDATRVGTTIAPEEANRQYEELKTRKEIAALEEADKSMPREASALAVERDRRAQLGARRQEYNDFKGADNLALYGTYENALAKLDAFNADRGRETTQWERDDLEAAYGALATKGEQSVTKEIKDFHKGLTVDSIAAYPDYETFKADVEDGRRPLTKTEDTLMRGKFGALKRKEAKANAPKPEKVEKPPKPAADAPADVIIESEHPAAREVGTKRVRDLGTAMAKNVATAAQLDVKIAEKRRQYEEDEDPLLASEIAQLQAQRQGLVDQNRQMLEEKEKLRSWGAGGKKTNGLKPRPKSATPKRKVLSDAEALARI